jgi:dienelactone hydrolase
MKQKLLLIFILCMYVLIAKAQRPPLDSAAVANWPLISNVKMSDDGAFALYLTGPASDQWKTLSVVRTDGRQQVTVDNVREAFFAGNAKYVMARTKGDSLVILDILNGGRRVYKDVKSLLIPKNGKGDVVAVRLISGQLVVLRADGGDPDTLEHAVRAVFNPSGRWLLWSTTASGGGERWSYFDCERHEGRIFWTGLSMGTAAFEGTTTKMAFLAKDKEGIGYAVWKYEIGADSAWCWLKSVVDQRGDTMAIENGRLDFFSATHGWFFHVHKLFKDSEIKEKSNGVIVWRYGDEYGSPATMAHHGMMLDKNRSFLAIGYEGPSRVVTLGIDGDWPGDPKLNIDGNGKYAVTWTAKNIGEEYRLAGERPDVYLINLKDGSRRCIKRGWEYADIGLSPGGKYVWWYNPKDRSYFTYAVASGVLINAGRGVSTVLYHEEWDRAADPLPYGLGGWIEGDAGMLVYDRYDIWRLDPNAIDPPRNITMGFGRSHKIRMRLITYYSPVEQNSPLIKGKRPIVASLDEKTKANGFFRIGLDGRKYPEQESLLTGEMCYYPETISFVTFPYSIIKADDANAFLVQKMSADKYPNFYATRDFRRFVPMSSLEPEKKYNWLTSELVHWKTFKGRDGAAIVYKPTDFDSTRKYPVIFYFYEVLTPGLNKYEYPEYSSGAINIPWFVSRGYIVVCPDIHYTLGNPGEGIYDYVVSGVNFLKGKSWVAPDRIGVEGHSWGGFEVNYLVTKTNLFRCAVAASGLSNLSSMYGLEGFSGCSGPAFTEEDSPRMGGTLPDSVNRYVENSPVFQASKVETPLLLMSNDKDGNVPWEQGVEMFTNLRRMDKKVWLLEYPDEAHIIGPKYAWDFTQRLTSYFDYYLKDGQEPNWMKTHPISVQSN